MEILWRDDDISVDTDLKKLKEVQNVFEQHGLRELYSVVPFGKTIYEFYDHSIPLGELENRLGDELLEDNREIIEFLKESIAKGHRIGLHGWKHTRVTDYSDAREQIMKAKYYLENLFDVEIEYFIPPFNHYNDSTIRICRELEMELLRDGGQLEKYPEGEFNMYWYHYWRINTKELDKWLKSRSLSPQ